MQFTIDDFRKELIDEIDNFVNYWVAQNKINPEIYPISIDENNAGQFFEQFIMFSNED